MKRLKAVISTISTSNRPFKLLLGILLKKSKLCSLIDIKGKGYSYHFFPTASSYTLWVYGCEHREDEFLQNILRSGDVVVDVGANIGNTAIPASMRVGEDGHIFSIEAHPGTYEYLCKNVRLNPHIRNISLYNYAVGDMQREVLFSDESQDTLRRVHSSTTKGRGVSVQMDTLDNILKEDVRGPITVLKIDTEGYEKFALEGAAETVDNAHCIYFESYVGHYGNYDYELRDVIRILLSYGFCYFFRINSHGELETISESYNSLQCENLVAVRDSDFLSQRGIRILSTVNSKS